MIKGPTEQEKRCNQFTEILDRADLPEGNQIPRSFEDEPTCKAINKKGIENLGELS